MHSAAMPQAKCARRLEVGRAVPARRGVWTFRLGQPEGLPEGSRRSLWVWGAATSGHPRKSPAPRTGRQTRRARWPGVKGRAVVRWLLGSCLQVSGTPPQGARPSDAVFRCSFHRCPERPPATLCQPCGLGSASEFSRECANPSLLPRRRGGTTRAVNSAFLDTSGRGCYHPLRC